MAAGGQGAGRLLSTRMEDELSFNLTREIGKLLPRPRTAPPRNGNKSGGSNGPVVTGGSPGDCRPVLQLNALPMTLSPKTYQNAHSSANPNGSYTALYAFSQLADVIPSFAEYFSPSLNTVSSVYDSVVHGASINGSGSFAEQSFANARETFDCAALSNMDGIAGTWYPVYATPVDWYDTEDPGRFSDISIDLSGGSDMNDGPYQILHPGRDTLVLHSAGNGIAGAVPIDPATSLQSVKFKYLEVVLDRPWLRFDIFSQGGWSISGQNTGYLSSGNANDNPGVMPLVTTSLLVGVSVELEAQWSAKDQQVLERAQQAGGQASVGPFVVNRDTNESPQSSGLHVIGWVSQLVPFAPRTS